MLYIVKQPWTDEKGHHAVGDRLGLERHIIARPDPLAEVGDAASHKAQEMLAARIARQALDQTRAGPRPPGESTVPTSSAPRRAGTACTWPTTSARLAMSGPPTRSRPPRPR